jgi:hypothetical protein
VRASWDIWRWSFTILAIVVGLLAIVRWAILGLVDSSMDALRATHLPASVSRASPAAEPLPIVLAGVRYELLIPKGANVRLPDGKTDFVEVWHPNTTRRIRMFRLGPSAVGSEETYARSETLMNGAVLRYNIDDNIGGGSSGTEGELKGRLEIGTKVLAVTCHDQDEFRAPNPYRICVPYLHHLRVE